MAGEGDDSLPQWSPRVVSWFRWYCRRYYFPPHFHALRILRTGLGHDLNPLGPLVVVVNHPSWWDPVISALLSTRYPERRVFAPIDSQALGTYRFFRKMGFFGVEQGTARGAVTFLRVAGRVLREPDAILWVTAQGRFTDPRQRPVRLMPGLGKALARFDGSATVLPVALEYPFWDEKNPEALVHFGEPVAVRPGHGLDGDGWTGLLSSRLEAAMDQLAAASVQRDPGLFETMQTGKAGVGGMYDRIRRLTAWMGLRRFDGSHAAALGKNDGTPKR